MNDNSLRQASDDISAEAREEQKNAAPGSKAFDKAIDAILIHSARLVEDAEMIEFSEPPTTALFLVQIAQEELAKAFLLCLVSRGIIPWHRHTLRATRDHTCKQLLAIVMDHLYPVDEEFDARIRAVIEKREPLEFPRKVADAINILRYEKIGRWVDSSWVWADDPEYDKEALAVAEGKLDRRKQDALYVRLGTNGTVASTPTALSQVPFAKEKDKAGRFSSIVRNLKDKEGGPGFDWPEVESAFRVIFSNAYRE